ncbi:ABC transporter substrate-binding protein [Streptomyces sp. DSM 44917]|uniref:ABC transporter substrate-binding protein n=1 Tax=Streptomyces boetiae TaxID=3075541 RepID=A0ABU2L9B4_9ACTN|nr:ABC transporter substrate-binding protein [Streptomyces sp. DSM 44917]MDT0308164.1 ABC transporter substrate-binding protein [Streptomyces sp. DSM 44917]
MGSNRAENRAESRAGTRGARTALGIGAAVLLLAAVVGGWAFVRADGTEDPPLVVGTTVVPTSTDPGAAYDAGSAMLAGNLYQSLLTFVPGQDAPVPDAAESCAFDAGRLLVYRCVLRSDLTFSDGRAVTPADVKFSFDRVLAMAERERREAGDPSIPEGRRFDYQGPAGLLATLREVRVAGQEIVFRLNRPDAGFPFVVAGSAGAIVDRHSYPELEPRENGRVLGSGPFLLSRWTGDSAELVPNASYRGAARVPEGPVTVRYFEQDAGGTTGERLLAQAWQAGEIDVNDGRMPPEVMAGLSAGDPSHRAYEATGGGIRVLAFNTREGAPFHRAAARRAAAALLDREALTRRVQHDTVEPLYSLIPTGFAGHGTPYYDRYAGADTGALREELEEAGVDLPLPFRLAYSRGPANHEEARLIEEQLEAGGIFAVETEYHPWAEFVSGLYAAEPYDAYLVGWQPDFPDPATFTDQLLGPADGLNTGFRDAAIDELIAETQAEPDRARAAGAFRAAHERAAGSAPVIPLWQERVTILSGTDVAGIQLLPSSSGVWRLWELRRI